MAADVSQTKTPDIAIIGGGISGVTLAIGLYKRGVNCTIYEAAPELTGVRGSIPISRNALRAMEQIDRCVLGAFNLVSTRNRSSSKKGVWADFVDGMSAQPATHLEPLFSITGAENIGHNIVPCARFLDELVRLLPKDMVRFDKELKHVLDDRIGSGKMLMKFEDGSVAEADAIIGCDGVKSRTRALVVGENHPAATASYTHKYAYRGDVPMSQATLVLGEERAMNSTCWLGKNRHCMTFPVDQGQNMRFLAFVTNDREDWPSDTKQCLSTTKAEALDDFRAFGPNVKHIIKLATGDFERWAIFDLGDYTLSSYFKDRICLLGEAAHGSSPHHEAGAGLCIEDAAVLACLLSNPAVKGVEMFEKVFAVYDAHRRERTQWHVQSSRRAGNLVEYLTRDVAGDIGKMAKELHERLSHIWNFDIEDSIREATKDLNRRLSVPGFQKFDSQEMPWFLNEHNNLEMQ
ncbi:hypothetical protein N8I77_001899 [Diaporthe amygdali]|uniref:FAD-binding domain-containing protein n=1 Tax=Phomopsis amygdali TaxID=1214568 RepID=A0AAD9W9V4_PHOAM|nr:hypothetical protein N8I77_001899 [Diaporthe amygdali]